MKWNRLCRALLLCAPLLVGCPEASDEGTPAGTETPAPSPTSTLAPTPMVGTPSPTPGPVTPTTVPTPTPAPVATPRPPTPTPSSITPAPTTDADGDGYLFAEDCDDDNPSVHPGADEVCNEIDDNCDGQVDEGVTTTYYEDQDGDGYGSPSAPVEACEPQPNVVLNGEDCDDTDPYTNPGAKEQCDGLDNDCDGEVDDSLYFVDYYLDEDGDGYGTGTPISRCAVPEGYIYQDGDCDDTNPAVNPDADEVCNDIDDDCDGEVDEYLAVTYYPDQDGDGFGAGDAVQACSPPPDHVTTAGDCDDSDPAIYPDATEWCNAMDDDCDGDIDEGFVTTYYTDADGDGFGAGDPTTSCDPASDQVATAGDCDDSDSSVNPDAVETCDHRDDDCDGEIDEDVPVFTWYADADGDGYGDSAGSVEDCMQPPDTVDNGDDCDDQDAATHPGVEEVCDEVDNDCDGNIDEGVTTAWYPDVDLDGYGDPTQEVLACTQPGGDYVTNGDDCDDMNPDASPAQTEVCDGFDNDCDGLVDDEDTVEGTTTWYLDADGDGYGVSSDTVEACERPDGYADNARDCDDTDPDRYLCPSCQTLLEEGLGTEDGFYALQTPRGSATVYCDMTFDGGGWTVVARSTTPSTWTNTNTHALGLYEHWIDEDNYSHDLRAWLDDPVPGARAEMRIYDHVDPDALDVVYGFDREAFLAVDLDDEANNATDIPLAIAHAQFDRDSKTYSVGETRQFVLRVGQKDSYATQYCDQVSTRSFINFLAGGPESVRATVCSHGLGVYNDAANYPAYHTGDDGRRVSIAIRFRADDGALGSESNPASSCAAIKDARPDAPSGLYWLALDSGDPIQAWCDQETEGGGWMRCAIIDYLPNTSTVIYGLDSATIGGDLDGSTLGDGGTQAIKQACFGPLDETGLGLAHTVGGGIGAPYSYTYWWEIPAVSPDQNVAFVTSGSNCSCDGLVNLSATPLSYPNALPRWLMAGDGVTAHQCYVGGSYVGTSSGWWMTFDARTDDTWLELSDASFDRLGVWDDSGNTKLAGVLEYWVR